MFVEVDHPALGPVTFTGNPLKLSRTPGAPGRIPPRLGEHTAEVLTDVLGMSDAEIGALIAGAAVA